MVFEQRKIQLETLSEYLREIRESLQLTIEDVNFKTGIKPEFLEALESGEFRKLPPDVYVLGFLRQLAEVYSINAAALQNQYKKEKVIQNQIQQRVQNERSWKKRYFGNLVITPTVLSIAAGALFVSITLLYIIWQVASINKIPSLDIYQPEDRQVIKASVVSVKGRTDPGMTVSVNGQDVFVDSEGLFQVQLGLEAGPKQLNFVASNKFGKTTAKTVSVVGQPDVAAATGDLSLQLQFSGDGTLTYSIDDGDAQTLVFRSGDSKVLVGHKKVVVSTTDAGATSATFNGEHLGPLGRSGERLVNIPFFAETTEVKQ